MRGGVPQAKKQTRRRRRSGHDRHYHGSRNDSEARRLARARSERKWNEDTMPKLDLGPERPPTLREMQTAILEMLDDVLLELAETRASQVYMALAVQGMAEKQTEHAQRIAQLRHAVESASASVEATVVRVGRARR